MISTGQKGRKFTTIASYESNRNEAKFGDLAVGDLNADNRPDVVLTDIAEHFIEIATFEAGQPDLTRGASFKVFEKKGSGRRNLGDLIEPRDMTLGDVDGDCRTDLILDRPRPDPRLPPGPRPRRLQGEGQERRQTQDRRRSRQGRRRGVKCGAVVDLDRALRHGFPRP